MKEPAQAINKGLYFDRWFHLSNKIAMVLSKRSLIHSNSFQLKI